MKRITLFLGILLITCMGFAQNPFSDYGYDVQMVTLTSGQFEELHDADRIVEIGDVRFDTKTGKIVGRIEEREVKEMDAQVVSRFISIDPLCEKYYSISPYVYCANNPINAVDFNGDSITIIHRTGFLGLGGKETLTYENGNLFNADGSAYTGKVKGYLKSAVRALGSLSATAAGATLVSELQNSTNMFTIKSGDNAFVANSPAKAGANLAEVQAVTGNTAGSSGSGGTIYWNANSTSGGLDLAGNTSRPAYIGLGHEMGHASDSNQGLLHFSTNYTNATTGATYFSSYRGLLKSEWRAVYRENLIRGQAGIPLRTHYGINMSTGVPVGIGPRLLSPLNRPLNYP